jgi:response regulator RpfG family c-di-GMP phosphodiesterase
MGNVREVLREATATPERRVSIEAPRSVLVVDDEAGVRNLMRRWLESRGYAVELASNAEQALRTLAATPIAVALCDLRMPGRHGLWLVDQLRREHPDTAVIIATAVDDVTATVEGLRQGVVDYLTKPFDRERLFEAVARGLDRHRALFDARRWRETLEAEMHARHVLLGELIGQWPVDSDESLDGLVATLTSRNPEAYAHGNRVAALSATLARAIGLTEPEIAIVQQGGLLHDLGKLAMPEAVLRKPAPLTAEEQRLIRLHPGLGCGLVERIPYVAQAAFLVRDVHERLDGLGYPRGSRGDAVWIGARIVSVADAYDTMTRARVFRGAITPHEALRELARSSGTQFDPRVVEVFTSLSSPTSP